MPQERSRALNSFQTFIRGMDLIRPIIGAAITAAASRDKSEERIQDLIRAGILETTIGIFVLAALIIRAYENHKQAQKNFLPFALRACISLIDITAGLLLLTDPSGKTAYSFAGGSLVTFGMFTSRAIGEDGHHDIQLESQEADHDIEKSRRGYQQL